MADIIKNVIQVIWYFFPAIVANMSPPFFRKFGIFEFLYKPISSKFLGKNKTYGGYIFGLFLASFSSFFQARGFLIGLIIGFGALLGDSVKSFFKRRLNIKEGHYTIFDSFDWIIGGAIAIFIYRFIKEDSTFIQFLSSFIKNNSIDLIFAVIGLFLGTIIINYISYRYLKIKESL